MPHSRPTVPRMNAAPLLTERDLAEHIGVPVKTLQRWRLDRTGPRYIKAGRHVRYRPEDITRWLDANTRGRGDAA